MKIYIDYNSDYIKFDESFIPKDKTNRDYATFLKELENREAELVPYTPPAPTWEDIKIKRNGLLIETDWLSFPDVTHPNRQAWLDYRQALRDIPQNFTNPQDVVWPVKPE